MEKETNSQNPHPNKVFTQNLTTEIKELLLTLPRENDIDGSSLYQYNGFWYWPQTLSGAICSQKHFQAQESDIILATFMKSGTTWLKALTYAIVHRDKYAFDQIHPVLITSPHTLIPNLEIEFSVNKNDFEHLPTPRVLATHVPYSFLPSSITNSKSCRVVYLCRSPLDQLVSYWHFILSINANGMKLDMMPIEGLFENICNGVQPYGPIWEHNLGYWKANSNGDISNILFLKYEDLKRDTIFYIEKLADFLGCSFSDAEKEQGIPKKITKLCSIENMKNYEINKEKVPGFNMPSTHFFGKGEVGDWRNYLTPAMWEQLRHTVEEKLLGSGLTFQMS